MEEFKVTTSVHGLPCLEFKDASKLIHIRLKQIVGANHLDSPAYQVTTNAGAFFQGGYQNSRGWLLIEFWKADGAQAFVDYAKAECEKALKECDTDFCLCEYEHNGPCSDPTFDRVTNP